MVSFEKKRESTLWGAKRNRRESHIQEHPNGKPTCHPEPRRLRVMCEPGRTKLKKEEIKPMTLNAHEAISAVRRRTGSG